MDVRALVDTVKARGVDFKMHGNRITVEARTEPDSETRALLDKLRDQRDELRRVLTSLARGANDQPPPPQEREEARRLAASQTEPAAVDQIINEHTIAVLIDSEVLGVRIWFALRDGWIPGPDDEKHPVFYASELSALRQKTAVQLRSIFNIKRVFGGGMVRQ